jgi:hypothetical protein
MWEPRHLTTLWASTACYRNSFLLCNLTVGELITVWVNDVMVRPLSCIGRWLKMMMKQVIAVVDKRIELDEKRSHQ